MVGASLTGVTVTGIVADCVGFTPSLMEAPRESLPLKFSVGVYVNPAGSANVAFNAASGAVIVTDDVPLPLTCAAVSPSATFVLTVTVPLTAVRVTVTLLSPASTSPNDRPLITADLSSNVVCDPGAAIVGASLTDVIVMMKVSAMLVSTPPLAVPPSSVAVTLNVAVPLEFGAA